MQALLLGTFRNVARTRIFRGVLAREKKNGGDFANAHLFCSVSRARQSRFALERIEAMKLACTETGCWYCLVPWKLRWPAPRVVHAEVSLTGV